MTSDVSLEFSQALNSIRQVIQETQKVIVGQKVLLEKLLMGILLDGHILIEGVPGLAKTTTVKSLARAIHASFQRIQFTPDLLPSDIIGTQIYNPKNQEFFVKKGPLFAQLILADEINRAPAKVQSALLEAMQEKQVTIGEQTFELPTPFIVMATQNPIENEGTYQLPEAQLDRFMFKLKITYPEKAEELEIINRFHEDKKVEINPVLSPQDILQIRSLIKKIYVDPKVSDYVTRLVGATRASAQLKIGLEKYIQFGASPRASLFLIAAGKVVAFYQGRQFVTPQDIKSIAMDVLRHRIILSFEAEMDGLTHEAIIQKVLDHVDVP